MRELLQRASRRPRELLEFSYDEKTMEMPSLKVSTILRSYINNELCSRYFPREKQYVSNHQERSKGGYTRSHSMDQLKKQNNNKKRSLLIPSCRTRLPSSEPMLSPLIRLAACATLSRRHQQIREHVRVSITIRRYEHTRIERTAKHSMYRTHDHSGHTSSKHSRHFKKRVL